MTDHPRTPDDELLRAALQSEVTDVHADDALLTRIRTAAAPPSAWKRRTPLLAMAAAAAIIAGLAAMLLTRDEKEAVVIEEPAAPGPGGTAETTTTIELDRSDEIVALFECDAASAAVVVVLVGGPEGSLAALQDALLAMPGRSGEEILKPKAVAERLAAAGTPADEQSVPGVVVGWFTSADAALEARATLADLQGVLAISSTDCAVAAPAGDRPTLVALVRDDGWLVTVDLETGEERELHTEGDPRQAEPGLEEGGPHFIDAVDLSPDGEWIYFSTCCEPADGMTFRIPTAGGEVEEVGFGAYPRVGPDGRYVATAGSAYLYVRPTDDVGFDVQPVLLEIGCCAKHLAWSSDGTELALVFGTGAEGETPQIRRFSWDGTTLAEADMGKPDNPGWFVLWMPDGMPVISSGDPIADDRGRSQDASYQWILWVDEEGVVKEQAGFETGDVTPIPGLPRALAADW